MTGFAAVSRETQKACYSWSCITAKAAAAAATAAAVVDRVCTGLSFKWGCLRRATETKKASKSTCKIHRPAAVAESVAAPGGVPAAAAVVGAAGLGDRRSNGE